MLNYSNVQNIQDCLDSYMLRIGKVEIDEIEANKELARAGLMTDDSSSPGQPLRDYLSTLRDANKLPQNIRQLYGAWKIKHSKTLAKVLQIFQF